ncbi:MAG: hypothetical protein Q4Q53_02050 [Methanocorpusculum sp.]|nr:hypothetical protein [Methanocorpusculum sp.]
MDELREQVKSGDSKAKQKLWRRYCDFSQEEIETMANSGDAYAECMLGDKFEGDENYIDAAIWYQKSADKGFDKGQFGLGLLYIQGCGVKKDVRKGIELLKASYAQGNGDAAEQLVMLEEEGLVEAGSWL